MNTATSTSYNREAFVLFLRDNPGLTLAQLTMFQPALLDRVRVGDLVRTDHTRRTKALALRGSEFDALVLEVIREAKGMVASGYIRDRVGGPRWKLQASLGRLVDAGHLARRGTTSMTRYWLVEPRSD
ncbi:hypothetical protein ACNOYE_34855 [Nannocystaceae bacterium ST9]